MIKTNEQRLATIQKICTQDIGTVQSVSLKLKGKTWTCTLKMAPDQYFESISVSDNDPTEAVKGLKNRLKRIIKRYHSI